MQISKDIGFISGSVTVCSLLPFTEELLNTEVMNDLIRLACKFEFVRLEHGRLCASSSTIWPALNSDSNNLGHLLNDYCVLN